MFAEETITTFDAAPTWVNRYILVCSMPPTPRQEALQSRAQLRIPRGSLELPWRRFAWRRSYGPPCRCRSATDFAMITRTLTPRSCAPIVALTSLALWMFHEAMRILDP